MRAVLVNKPGGLRLLSSAAGKARHWPTFPASTAAVARGATRRVPPPSGPSGGTITLVGAGPGSPDLLTLAAYEAIRRADVIICDKIASKALKDLVPPHAQ